jgi:hypothetical protein
VTANLAYFLPKTCHGVRVGSSKLEFASLGLCASPRSTMLSEVTESFAPPHAAITALAMAATIAVAL